MGAGNLVKIACDGMAHNIVPRTLQLIDWISVGADSVKKCSPYMLQRTKSNFIIGGSDMDLIFAKSSYPLIVSISTQIFLLIYFVNSP